MCKLKREKNHSIHSSAKSSITFYTSPENYYLFNLSVFLGYLSFRTNNETPGFSMTTTVNRVERVATEPWDSTTGQKKVTVTKSVLSYRPHTV